MLRLRIAAAALISVGLSWCIAPLASAVTYTYAGNSFSAFASGPYSNSDSLSVSFELAAALGGGLSDVDITPALLTFSANDGVQTITQATPVTTKEFRVSTSLGGDITAWGIGVGVAGTFFIKSCGGLATTPPSPKCSLNEAADRGTLNPWHGVNFDSPGTWNTLPEPSTALLAAMGLACFGARGRAKRG
jgi:hypothetical protein